MSDIEAIFDIETTEIEAEFEIASTNLDALFQVDARIEWLRQLQDVSIVDVQDDQHLVYNASTEKWENKTAYFVYEQGIAAEEWTITHNLGKFPSVTVVDSAGTKVEASVIYIDGNTCTVSMNAAFKGKAFLN